MTRLSLCAIVRDEQRELPRLLASVRGVVDELCVLDTGSVDDTVSIARAAGARVEHFTWCDDFAAARNASLAMASGDWVLVLDADEALLGLTPEQTRARLEAFAAAHPEHAGQVVIVDRQEQGELRSRVSRFFPLRQGLRYVGRIHEQAWLDGAPCRPQRLDVEVAHSGYTQDALMAKDKVARNRKLLEQSLREQPTDAYRWYQLGRTHLVAVEFELALDAFTSALDHAEPTAPYLPLLVELTCQSLRRLERSGEALQLLQQLAPAWPERADTRYLEGLLALDTHRFGLAEARLQQCLLLAESNGAGGSTSEAARTYGPAFHLGVLRERLGLVDEAREWFERALAFRPDHAESLAGLQRLAGALAENS